MDKFHRRKIGIIFNFDPKWMGGIIYLLNAIRVLKFLDDKDMPQIIVFYEPKLKSFIDEIDYPYIEKVPWKFCSVHYGFVLSILTRKNIFIDDMVTKYKLDALFPNSNFPVKRKPKAKIVSWTADLQHKYYPEFFKKRNRLERNLRIKFKLKNSSEIVVSSQAVKDDFFKFFSISRSVNFHIYHFVSIIDDLPEIEFEEIRAKYNLPEEYFMISNQFHKHKNHKVVFKALAELKGRSKKVHCAITGKFPDEPNSEYMNELHDIISNQSLKSNISFLGLIPRGDQLLLMKYAKAIIQPSLFEGWSTVIEDAKSLQVPVIASNLPVNIEQLQEKGIYFEPHDYLSLAKILELYPKRNLSKRIYEKYEIRMEKAAYEFLNIFNE